MKKVKGKKLKKSSLETMPKNTKAALCYLLGWLTGIFFFLTEKKDEEIRFHALQSIITFGGLTVISFVPLIGWILSPLIMIAGFVLWLVLIIKTYQGEKIELPIAADLAKKQLAKK